MWNCLTGIQRSQDRNICPNVSMDCVTQTWSRNATRRFFFVTDILNRQQCEHYLLSRSRASLVTAGRQYEMHLSLGTAQRQKNRGVLWSHTETCEPFYFGCWYIVNDIYIFNYLCVLCSCAVIGQNITVSQVIASYRDLRSFVTLMYKETCRYWMGKPAI